MSLRLYHFILKAYTWPYYRKFRFALARPEAVQRERLRVLTGLSYEDFQRQFPVTEYPAYQESFEARRKKNLETFVPTSGSGSEMKWIPYTKELKAEFWRAAAPWIHDLYLSDPAIEEGHHFWSLSWLPEDLRGIVSTDDTKVLGRLESFLMKNIMTLDESVSKAPTMKESMRLMLRKLLTRRTSLISVWSPTFLLELLNLLEQEKDQLQAGLPSDVAQRLRSFSLTAPNLKKLFPELRHISAWESSTSRDYAEKLKALFPHVTFSGKGLWATEGVVTIPFENKYPLALLSHFYEFQDPMTKEIYPPWKLAEGMTVNPLLTTGGGLRRYLIPDLLRVSDFLQQTPCFEFLGRSQEIDLVGEKLSHDLCLRILQKLRKDWSCPAVCFFAHQKDPHYELLIEGEQESTIAGEAEAELQKSFHYRLARESGQLGELQVTFVSSGLEEYLKRTQRQIRIAGNIKVEPVVLLKA